MANFTRIKLNIEQLEPIVARLESRHKAFPDDFSILVELTSLNNQLSDLREQLYRENLKREKEVIELRLIGQSLNIGNIPLEYVGGITDNLSAFIFNISKYKMYGGKGGKKKDLLVKNTIDLRLEGIGRGSTVFYLSGKTSPDLFGNSTIQDALQITFELFQSKPDELIDRVGSVGPGSVKYIARLLDVLSKQQLDIDLMWHSPDNQKHLWEGREDNIKRLYNSLNQMIISQPKDISFEGELITISSKGRFEIVTNEGDSLLGHFSSHLLEKMKKFHIGDYCKGIITKTRIYSPLTQKEKFEYDLKKIE